MRISDWSSDVCSSDLRRFAPDRGRARPEPRAAHPVRRLPMSASPSTSELSVGLPAASAVGEPTVLGMRPKPALVLLILAALALTVVGYAWWALGVANGNWPTLDRKSTRLNSSH